MARPKPAMLTACLPLLRQIKTNGPQIVYAETLVQAGMAVEGGYANVEDSHDGPELRLTDAGLKSLATKTRT